LQEKFPDIPVLYVYGNCDFSYDRKEQEKELELGGKKFFVLHGHTRNVKISLDSLRTIAEQKKYDIILYGHTHIPREDYHEGTYIVCPGSISRNYDIMGKSYCVIDITGNDMCANIIKI
jgi:putative phosphoesterase